MGEPFRVPYGFAIGHANQFAHHKGFATLDTAGLLKQCATEVDVTVGSLFYTNNSGSTTISALTCNTYSSNTGYQEGRIIRIMFLDTATQIANGTGNIVLAGTGNYGLKANATIDLMQSRGNWYEISRSPVQTQDTISVNMAGTTNQSVSANGVQNIVVTGTAAATTIQSISGGYTGQKITLVLASSSGITYTVNTAGNLKLNGGQLTVINGDRALTFIKTSSTQWMLDSSWAEIGGVSNVNLAGTTNCSVDANGNSVVVVTQTSTATQFSAISGGFTGQQVTVVFLNTATSVVTLTTGGNLTFGNTAGTMVMNTGGAVHAVKANATTWYVLNPPPAKLV